MLEQELITIRRHIHQNPEIGINCYNTAEYIYNYLYDIGYRNLKYVVNKSGVICFLDNQKEESILLRSDIDALEITEQFECDYKSQNNYMHACGHDAHTAMLLIAAKMIFNIKEQLNYNIVFVFQPAEEGPLPGGALRLINEINYPNIVACFAFHVTNLLNTGEIGIKNEEAFSAPDLFEGEIIGKGCHASTPQFGINPLIPMGEVLLKFQDENNNYPNDRVVISITHVEGGRAKNIIPDKIKFEGTARSFKNETRDSLNKNLTKIVEDSAKKYGAIGHFNFLYAYDPLYNDPNLFKFMKSMASNINLNFVELKEANMVGEDFSYYRRIAPICMTWLGVYNSNNKKEDLHSPTFTLDEKALINGSLLYVEIVKNFKKGK